MAEQRREFVDSRLRRCPPDRASAVSYGQAGENALHFPHLAHRSTAVHKLHSATTAARFDFDSGKGKTFSRLRALAYSSRNLSRRPGPPHNKAEKQFLFYATEHRKQGKTGKAATNYEYGLLCGYALEHLKLTTRCEHEIEVKSSPQGEYGVCKKCGEPTDD